MQQATKQLGEDAQILAAALGWQALSASVLHRQQLCGGAGRLVLSGLNEAEVACMFSSIVSGTFVDISSA